MPKNGITNYRDAQDLHQQELRKGILDDTSDLLMREGTTALSMRRIAQLVSCSTTVLYTMFGNKQGLVDELYLRGFEMLRQAIEAVPCSGHPQDYIYALCAAYHNFALTHATYYAIMFLKIMPDYTPSKENLEVGEKSLQFLIKAVQDCATPQTIPEAISESEAWEIARIIWATVHGHVGLELAGHFGYPGVSSQQMLKRALQAIVEQLLPTPNPIP
ncbi:MAG: TetR/AcrR family transcriptional regulator [Oculatellaceae cyanobacterium Prado106]|jgi:AcrR family transcriptional regulator|nr:TetR/AcrR family transcriptional regulator [Oculatellaceae cyanobacterium Prado106]